MNISLYYFKFSPLIYGFLYVVQCLLWSYFILIAQCCGKALDREISLLKCLFPEPCGGLVEAEHTAEIDCVKAFAYYYVLSADGAEDESFLYFQIAYFFLFKRLRAARMYRRRGLMWYQRFALAIRAFE